MTPASLDPVAFRLTATEWEVLYLLHDALGQLRKMTMSFSELRYLAVEHSEADIRQAVQALLDPAGHGKPFATPLAVAIPNLTNLPIYRITPLGRDLVKREQGFASYSTVK
ncbi:MAG: hypothetical protein M3Z04_11905 [Chloroflexota bacterium]|nr:hypothetical protein [Chloroflexota bacterium]